MTTKTASADAQEFARVLHDHLPPVISRKAVEHYTGGMLTRKTMANLDSKGQGPADAYAVGKHIVYKRESFVEWLLKTHPVIKLHTRINAEA